MLYVVCCLLAFKEEEEGGFVRLGTRRSLKNAKLDNHRRPQLVVPFRASVTSQAEARSDLPNVADPLLNTQRLSTTLRVLSLSMTAQGTDSSRIDTSFIPSGSQCLHRSSYSTNRRHLHHHQNVFTNVQTFLSRNLY